MLNRVVVTGMGIISPLGQKEEMWANLLQGVSGVRNITRFDASDLPVQIGAEVNNFDPTLYMERKEARRMDRFAQFAVAAAKLALEDGGLELPFQDPTRVGVLVGSGPCICAR